MRRGIGGLEMVPQLLFISFRFAFPVGGEVEYRRRSSGGGSKVAGGGGGVKEVGEGVAYGPERVKVGDVSFGEIVTLPQSGVEEVQTLTAELHRLRVVAL